MKVIWLGIFDRGNIATERVHFRALSDIDLKFYAIFDTSYIDTSRIFIGNRSCYWFVSQQIKAGDNIVVYTRVGVPNLETRNDGSIFHFFFRGLTQSLYSQTKDCAVIFEIGNWITTTQGI